MMAGEELSEKAVKGTQSGKCTSAHPDDRPARCAGDSRRAYGVTHLASDEEAVLSVVVADQYGS